MIHLQLSRFADKVKQTLGKLIVYDGGSLVWFCWTVELPWLNNARLVSCIPGGKYKCKKRWSEKYGWHIHIQDVPGRDMVLIHNANFSRQLKGCVAVGDTHTDIDKDGLQDVTNSKATLGKLIALLPEEFELEIL